MRDYKLISADSHVNEPPDLWTSRLAEQNRDRAPRIERFEQGDAWVMESALDPMNFGGNCSAGGGVRCGDCRKADIAVQHRIRRETTATVAGVVALVTPRSYTETRMYHSLFAHRGHNV